MSGAEEGVKVPVGSPIQSGGVGEDASAFAILDPAGERQILPSGLQLGSCFGIETFYVQKSGWIRYVSAFSIEIMGRSANNMLIK